MHKYLKHRYKLAHLPNHIQDEITERYYNGENVQQIISQYELDIKENSFFLLLPLKTENNLTCRYCGADLYKIPPSKTRLDKKEYICKDCYHIDGRYNCECRNCILEKQSKAHRDQIIKKVKKFKKNPKDIDSLDNSKTINIQELSKVDEILLGALLREHMPTKDCIITINKASKSNLAPTITFKNIIMNKLLDKNILFKISSTDRYIKFAINVNGLCQDKEKVFSLIYPKKTDETAQELRELIQDLQIYETVEYFSLTVQHRFLMVDIPEKSIIDKFYIIFSIILHDGYSTAQLFNFVYTSIKNYAANHNYASIYVDDMLTKIHQNILRYYQKAKEEGWEIKKYSRTYKIQYSELYKILSEKLGQEKDLFYFHSISG